MSFRQSFFRGALFCLLAFLSANLYATQVPGPLVDTAWLKNNLDQVVILDVREDTKSFEKKSTESGGTVNPCGVASKQGPAEVTGHIPGAVLVPWDKVTTKRKVEGKEIKALLPEKEDFERLMQKSGVDNDSAVIITSKGEKVVDTALAARLYWTLKYFGFDNVALLDGGTAQWMKDKQDVEFGRSRAKKGNFQATAERGEILAGTDDVMKLSEGQIEGQLLDARSTAEYLGLTSSGKFVAPGVKGHVAGSKSLPVDLYANSMGPARLYGKDEIRQVSELLGVDPAKPTVTLCNSGVMASLTWFALHEILGNENVRVYDGSMHEWSNTGKPVVPMKIE